MGAVHAEMLQILGYDPDDGVPQLADVREIDVPVGRIVRAREGANDVAVARLESGRIVIVEDTCPHDGGRISDGFVVGERLVCSRHGWELEPCGRTCTRVR
jgi:phenylpropionate dioxygenase-like ring-hydroxylating dioxygenase large terminal subunit